MQALEVDLGAVRQGTHRSWVPWIMEQVLLLHPARGRTTSIFLLNSVLLEYFTSSRTVMIITWPPDYLATVGRTKTTAK